MQHQGQAAGYLPSNEQIASNIPVGYLGTGADIAAAVGFCVRKKRGTSPVRSWASMADR